MNLNPQKQNHFKKFLKGIPEKGILSVLALVEEGATVPFIARYRKEKTGNLDEVQIRSIIDVNETFDQLVKRKEFVLDEIEKQGNLTPELKKQITDCDELGELEEIYRPYKRKKKTKATLARDAGIEPLADWIWGIGHGEVDPAGVTLEVKAKEFINQEKGYVTYEEILRGAQHIIVERLANDSELRSKVKEDYQKNAKIISEKGQKYKVHSKYETYKEYSESVVKLQTPKTSHRYLAIRRGWQEGELKVRMESNDEQLLSIFESAALSKPDVVASSFLKGCAKTALNVHVVPSIVNEIHRQLKELADTHAITVFAQNVKKVLMGSPFGSKVVLGVDPGIRTGCKIALVDKSGTFVTDTVLHTEGEGAKEKAKKLFGEVAQQITIEAVAVGNGTHGRETEKFISDIFKELKLEIPVVLVNESGASIYSASDVAREEFPELDLTIRGAISIARRLQDPLAELVKIEPKSIGVGQYQHDVNQTQLKKSLHNVVEDCVNHVGVNLNTASESLLQYVAGIGPAVAKNIVTHRQEKGLFKSRQQLQDVSRFSSKTFEQSAGFLRIVDGDSPLDATGVHPERYQAVNDMAKEAGMTAKELMGKASKTLDRSKWAELVGGFTFNDIVKELDEPGRDPRDPYKIFKFRDDIHEVKDLAKEMLCPGIVTNVTNFGAFVDIGVHQDGLVHISELSNSFIDDPKKVVSPGDQVQVKVLGVDVEKKQISLSLLVDGKQPQTQRPGNKKSARPGSGKGKKGQTGAKGKRPQGKRPPKKGGSPRAPKRPAFSQNPFADLAAQLKSGDDN
tara:strand:+ start:44685 stop:47069 length:2385 start_codon:yes stop_codon:yes gene_type:complete